MLSFVVVLNRFWTLESVFLEVAHCIEFMKLMDFTYILFTMMDLYS